MARRRSRRHFGNVRKLPSGRYQARYMGPDGRAYTARMADGRALTFETSGDADAFLARVYGDIQRGMWVSPDAPRRTIPELRGYAEGWLASRELSETTRALYRGLLDSFILPAFGGTVLPSITAASVREWYAALKTGPTRRSHAYSLLRTILNTAVAEEIIPSNPCRIRGAGSAKRARTIRPATLPELEAIVGSVPERYKLMIMLAAWCALRFGELAELRRGDIDVSTQLIRVRRSVVRPGNRGRMVKGPKSEAGKRDVAIPPHLMPLVKAHLRDHTDSGSAALLFPSAGDAKRQMAPSALYAVFFPAREKAGRPDLNFHDLRHTGATLAAVSGATLRELMARLGHSTPSAAMTYQHAVADRDKAIAEALSALASGNVVPISRARQTG